MRRKNLTRNDVGSLSAYMRYTGNIHQTAFGQVFHFFKDLLRFIGEFYSLALFKTFGQVIKNP